MVRIKQACNFFLSRFVADVTVNWRFSFNMYACILAVFRRCIQMDSWATDGFYSHFPSYSQQPNQREVLAKARQRDYQAFLNHISPKKIVSHATLQKRHNINDGQQKRSKKPTATSPPQTKRNELPKLDIHIVNANATSTEPAAMTGSSTDTRKARNDFVNELEQMDLPDIFNDERISARNEKMAEVSD